MDVDEETLVEKGIVSYADSVEEAKKLGRCGDTPLVVKAIAPKDTQFEADVIVSEEDGQLILKADEMTKFLSDLKVVIVI